ncbi:RimJ/RimL family protein N-acetyltransferase [Enterococcus lemanii]|nr:RimJ/RimL family protein N-acetyltransferase [Enterococcus lemanii]
MINKIFKTIYSGGEKIMALVTKRLILRSWKESDAENLFEQAKDPNVGPSAGWSPHQNVDESREVIKNVFCKQECYAICLKEEDAPIGCIGLKLNESTEMTKSDEECELSYWVGKNFWGQGLIPEAASELIRHGFEELNMTQIWCGYYDGNMKSKRVQEKIGFVYHHTCQEVPVPLLGETKIGHINHLTKERWLARQ